MAPLPSNSTPRFKIHYTNGVASHTINVRWGGSPAALSTAMQGVLTGLNALVMDSSVDLVEFSAAGSNVFNSVVSGLEGFAFGSSPGNLEYNSQYVNFIGRSTGGRRTRMAVFGLINQASDFRFAAGESASLDSIIALLNDPGQPFQCIDGLHPIWKAYSNAGSNVHWQKASRP